MKEIENLLTQITAIRKQYDKMAELTGENFNVFKVLGLTTNEVRTHSAFIAELLNPKGSHGQKDVFLKLFCEILVNNQNQNKKMQKDKPDDFDVNNFKFENANVGVEIYIGKINDEKNEGGRLDIIIKDAENKNAIFIENKIYAYLQENQLERYENYGKKVYGEKKYILFYLSLDEDEVVFVNKITYKETIISWLLLCKEKAVNHPILRETITQYINLIKYLTGQTMNEDMKKEIVDKIVANGDNFGAALEISNNIKFAKINLMYKFGQMIKTRLTELKSEVQVIIVDDRFGERFKSIIFKYEQNNKEFLHLSCQYEFEKFYFEFFNENNEDKPLKQNSVNRVYYSSKLNTLEGNLSMNNICDVTKGYWFGDWVCMYPFLDNNINENFWENLANGECQIVEDVVKDIIFLLDKTKDKLMNQP